MGRADVEDEMAGGADRAGLETSLYHSSSSEKWACFTPFFPPLFPLMIEGRGLLTRPFGEAESSLSVARSSRSSRLCVLRPESSDSWREKSNKKS